MSKAEKVFGGFHTGNPAYGVVEKFPWINYLPPHIKDFLEEILVNILEGKFLEAAKLPTDVKKSRVSILDHNKFHLTSKDFAIFFSKWQ